MPWQLFGNGRSDWSTKLTRGLEAETAAGFQSRRGRCREPTPVTPQYATFQTYKAARVHHACRRCGGGMAARGRRAAADDAGDWISEQHIVERLYALSDCLSRRTTRGRLCRGAERYNRVSLGGRSLRAVAGIGRRSGYSSRILVRRAGWEAV